MKKYIMTSLGLALFSQIITAQTEENVENKNIEQSEVIAKLVELKKTTGLNENLDKIYTIQIFSGKKDNAMVALKEVKEKHPELLSNIYYEYPNYKIKIGKYRNRLEADKELLSIKEEYPHAFIINPKR
ncbi:SPOR domain-containing protein [Neptunitalea lumnitzerae]|nr:SPOR domain-containing protein [Neptunitalea sp. Y10]